MVRTCSKYKFQAPGALFLLALVALIPELSFAQEEASTLDTGDTAWVLISSALVLMMTIPGLFLFYGGLVRSKNALGTMMQSFFLAGLVSIQWAIIGYSLAFGTDISSLVGGLDFFGLSGVGPEPLDGSTIPHSLFMVYQMTFAIITVALISGAFAERMKFSAFIVFSLLWTTIIYDPLAHWVWGGGWIGAMGALDFAGGTVVHISSGAAALAAALLLGKRIGYGKQPMAPHLLPFSVIGAALLWVGWFGFNAGSERARGHRLRNDSARIRGSGPGVVGRRMDGQGQAHGSRRGHRSSRGPRRHHAGGGFRRPDVSHNNRHRRRRALLLRRKPEA